MGGVGAKRLLMRGSKLFNNRGVSDLEHRRDERKDERKVGQQQGRQGQQGSYGGGQAGSYPKGGSGHERQGESSQLIEKGNRGVNEKDPIQDKYKGGDIGGRGRDVGTTGGGYGGGTSRDVDEDLEDL